MGKIENLSRTVTEIINKGIELTSSQPMYFYTKLADVKQQMIADATKDARERAKKIAENAGSSLGSLKSQHGSYTDYSTQFRRRLFMGRCIQHLFQRERSQHYYQIRISGRLNYLKSEFHLIFTL